MPKALKPKAPIPKPKLSCKEWLKMIFETSLGPQQEFTDSRVPLKGSLKGFIVGFYGIGVLITTSTYTQPGFTRFWTA